MATSSDWIGALAEAPAPAPGWLRLLDGESGFRPETPFAISASQPAPPPRGPDPAVEALACAYAEGQAAGRAAAEEEAEAQTLRQRALRLNFRALDEAAMGVLADDLAATVIALCDGVLGEAAIDRDALRARCEAAARRIGGAAGSLALHLNPDDIAMLGDGLPEWRIVPDPALERGSLRIEGADGCISDGPAEWRRAIAAAVRG